MLADDVVALLQQQVKKVETALGDGPGAVVGALQRMLNRVEELLRRAVTDAERCGEWAAEGFRSVGPWAALHAGLTPAAGRRLAHQARVTAGLAATSGRASEGLLHADQVRRIVRCAAAAPEQFDPGCDEAFSALAASGDHASFAQATRGWLAAVDAGRGPDAAPVEARARLSIAETFEGWWHGEFLLTPEDGALLHEAIERRAGRYLRARRDGDPSVGPLPMPAVRAQALADIADAALRQDGSKRCAPDRYSIAVTYQAGPDGTVTSEGSPPPGAACDASIYRLVVGAAGEVLELGRSVRTAPPYLAAAVVRRDKHCTFPGCDAPPGHCDCHHGQDWDLGGETNIDNLMLFCRWHHGFVHKRKWSVRLDEHQRPVFTKPDGAIHTIGPTRYAPVARAG